ncbi:hypothetical protein, conserved [Trypanosoma brucei gambiense DAL972]|uniref:Uncharacterized protein n=3 Tax=Trypanosoma brucei TaxID=5691 RepID=Q586J6_TRYB2|nr:hypothetical protein, conserved [Trypanosoma brucei gambiense DAL972]XP_951526.1 hypothetical protein, conserved [Trypanosoma brucei brucei TREU927]AAX79174.1 hypothetical protein, conserved [Trypanosoma brucei]RHW74116.1 hypothetical protein DPX39_020005500 [Trypanosoma brucei equiperdum]AAQ15671.1 hypothetical protein, conserved [Trypanosoma brucei brucei TREU927]CBH09350.1 hypothetical protein, conserved [Trypanosoma brucei gambiense DAL972]|eukprot:XP_011771656.1 hypothetical protein, conserved [Trypanosoma brucei gambiense DAL972]
MSYVENVMARATKRKGDPFLRDGTRSLRFIRYYRTLPYPIRMSGIFALGFALGSIVEIFACKTHLYESVMANKDARRHDFDEFVVEFRENVENWQQQDAMRRADAQGK